MNKCSKYKYDAFISYRHTSPDADIAKKLHSLIEHYHIPGKLRERSGKKAFNRVFRDREELPLSSDLSENIFEALSASEFLIVICSPASLESLWVQKEVTEFVRLHGVDRVITIVADGEPDEVFPDIICHKDVTYVEPDGKVVTVQKEREPLAADVRSIDSKGCIKKLKSEYLRVIAAMLNTGYDDVYNRHQRYRMRRAFSVISIVAVAAGLFGVYASVKNVALQEQYRIVSEKEARNVSGNVIRMLKEGDRTGALETLLPILPDDPSEQEPVPEVICALNQILQTYRHNGSKLYAPLRTIHLPGIIQGKACMSDDGTKILCSDDSGHVVMVYGDTFGEMKDFSELGRFQWYGFIDSTHAVLGGTDFIYTIDTSQPDNIHRVPCLSDSSKAINSWGEWIGQIFCVSPKFVIIAQENENEISIYPVIGSLLAEGHSISLKNTGYDSVCALAVSEDGRYIAVALESSEYNYENPDNNMNKGKIMILDSASEFSLVSQIQCGTVAEMRFVDDNHIAAIHYTDVSETSGDMINTASLLYYDRYYRCVLYDTIAGKVDVETEPRRYTTSFEIDNIGLFATDHLPAVSGSTVPAIVFFCHDFLYILNRETYEVIQMTNFRSSIVSVSQGTNGELIVMLADGTVYNLTNGVISKILKIDSNISSALYSECNNIILQLLEKRDTLIVSSIPEDDDMKMIGEELPFRIEDEADNGEEALGEKGDLKAVFKDESISILSLKTGETQCSYHLAYTDGLLFDFFRDDGFLIIYDSRPHITIINVHNGDVVCDIYPEFEYLIKTGISSDASGRYIAFCADEGVMQITDSGMTSPTLDIMYCSDDLNLYQYASLPWGFIDFEKMKIYSRDQVQKKYYESSFYSFEYLCAKAGNLY